MSDDLFTQPSKPKEEDSNSSPEAPVEELAPSQTEDIQSLENNVDEPAFNLDFLNLENFENIQPEDIISILNYFSLAWTIFYSVLFVSNFFYFFVLYSGDGELPREKKGVHSLHRATSFWFTYLGCLILAWIYTLQIPFANIFGFLVIIAYLSKLLIHDLRYIPVLQNIPEFIVGVVSSIPLRLPSNKLGVEEEGKK